MSKFGLYKSGDSEPLAVYEGDCLRMNSERVEIFTLGEREQLVAAIPLDKDHEVRIAPIPKVKWPPALG